MYTSIPYFIKLKCLSHATQTGSESRDIKRPANSLRKYKNTEYQLDVHDMQQRSLTNDVVFDYIAYTVDNAKTHALLHA